MNKRNKRGLRLALSLAVFIFVSIVCRGTGRADSIWNTSSTPPSSLYSATTTGEYNRGDIITILIVENLRASNSASLETDKESDLDMKFNGFEEILGLNHVFSRNLTDDPSMGINAQSEFDGDASSRRTSSVSGTVTGQITEVLPNGNLRIEATQTTAINGEKNSVVLVGTIRPDDITPNNTILSTQVANAEIRYDGVGPLSNTQKRGVIKEFFEFIWPF